MYVVCIRWLILDMTKEDLPVDGFHYYRLQVSVGSTEYIRSSNGMPLEPLSHIETNASTPS